MCAADTLSLFRCSLASGAWERAAEYILERLVVAKVSVRGYLIDNFSLTLHAPLWWPDRWR